MQLEEEMGKESQAGEGQVFFLFYHEVKEVEFHVPFSPSFPPPACPSFFPSF